MQGVVRHGRNGILPALPGADSARMVRLMTPKSSLLLPLEYVGVTAERFFNR